MGGVKGVVGEVQASSGPSLEPLESRLLLSGDLIGTEMPAPLEASLGGSAVEVDLDCEDEQLPRSDPALILSYLASAQDQDDVANPVESSPSGTDTLPDTQDELGTTVEAPVDSDGVALPFQDESSFLIAVDPQDVISDPQHLPIDARGPPEQETVEAGANNSQALELFGVSPALFVENQGQWADSAVRYMHDGACLDVAVTDSGLWFQTSRQDPTLEEDAADLAAWDNHALQAKGADVQALLFSASFVGAEAVQPVGLRPSDSLFNYCVGEPAGWRQNVPSYEVAAYEGLYEGIDLHVQGLRSHVKYEFHVAPNADYRQIAICYEGIEGLSIASDGSLVVDLGHDWGVMRDDAPYIYQEINGQKVEVAGRFILLDDHTYSFEITGEMDPDHVLVIDPDLAWSTYLGGAASGDSGQGIAVDTTGNVYVTGYTASSDWVSGGYDTTLGGLDAFVAKLSSDGGHLWSTYVGGSNRDWAYDIAVDSAGSAYVTGETESSGWISGGYDTSYGGGNCDAFVVKLTSAGGHAWSTYLAGFHAEISDEIGRGIAVDADGAAYVTGVTMDSDYMSNGGPYDAFIAKLTSTGGHAWSTYLGGSDLDRGEAIALDNVGAVYVTGSTYSSGWVNGGFDTTKDGFTDGFVVKVTDAGDHVWSTYVGGSEYDRGYDIAVDLAGSVYVTGLTWSTGWVSGGYDTDDSERDIFVAKLSNRGDHEWSTYLGEADDAEPSAIAVDAAGNVYVTSVIKSSGWASGGFDTSYNGGYNDAYVVKLTTAGGHAWSSFLGGAEPDLVQAIAVDADGNVYVTGITSSPDWTSGGFDTTLSGACDAFVAKITPDMNPDPAPVIAPGLAWSSYLGGANDERSRGIAVDATGCIYTTGYTYSADWTSGGFDTDYDGVVCDAFVVKLSPTGEHCWSTYVGGSIADCGDAIAVDALGNVYVTGWTRSTGWTSGGFDTTHNGIDDVFVAKLSSSGEHLWSTYLGGSSDDRGYGIAVDCSGNVYVTGVTDSDGWTSGGFDTTHNGLTDAFVAKLSGSGEHLWSTYLGGSYWDLGSDIAVDRSGNVYVSGMSYMTDDGLPNYDAFVTALSGSGEHLWSTYLGGSNYESGTGIAVDATGCIYTTGYTSSAGWTSGGFDTTYNGGAPLGGDVFIAKLSSSGGHLWSTYLGGSSDDYGDGIAVDASGNVYATGRTDSDGWANGGLDTTHNGGSDAFLVKLNSSGGHFWSTYLGGDEDDYGWDIVVDTSGGVYVTGETESSGWTRDGYDTTYNGATEAFVEETTDAFVAKIASHTDPVQGVVTTPGLAWSSYLGGADDDRGNGIVVDTSGNVYMTGDTTSIGWANSGFDAIHNGGLDIFVAKLSAGGDHLWSTYLGGGDDDYGYGIALDASGNVYVTGITGSAAWTHGGFDTTYNGGDDVFVAKLSSGGDHLWSAYLGGSDDDGGYGIAVDASGNVCVTGGTCSAGWTSGGFDAIHNGGHDAFVVKLSPGGDHLWSTYMGGSALEFGFDIAADTSGSVYVAGFTYSGGWATGGFDTTYNGQGDAFVAKLGSDGDHLWSTYLGGSEYDYGSGIAVDASGQVCVMGFSYSAGWTSGGFDTTLDGGEDVFVAKLNATGTHLWSTYLGGSSYDGGNDIAVDASGSIYVTGSTGSVGWVSGGFDTTYNGSGSDAFVAKFTDEPALASLWSSYLGGSSDDYGYGVAVDGSGNVYVTGHSPSSGWASGGFDTTHNGGADAFVAKFSPSGTHLWSTYLGGSSDDFGSDIAVDGLGNVYLTGYTYSSGWTSGGFDPSHNGGADVFVAKLSASGSYLWSTYLGGSDNDYGMAIAVAGSDNICVTGRTDSADWTNEGFDTVYDGGSDAFVAKLNSSGTLLWSTYLGGSSFDYGAGIAVDASGKVYATGRSDSAGWASGGLDTTYNGGPDAFLVKLDSNGGHLWSTYLGGSGNDYGSGVAVDALGNVYVTGCSESTDWTSGSFGTTHNGAGDVFVAKFNGIGAHLWSTYLGGSAYDYGYDIALDAWSNVHVTGTTSSAGWTSGGFDTTFDAGDGFAAKLSSTGVHLWSTYVGGSGWDGAYGIAVDSLGGIYVAGYTSSAGWTSAGFDTTHNGSGDAFVVKITDAINVAQGKVATQSSTGWGGSADKAVDGNTDGVYADGSVTHTQYDANAWWQVDLGGLYQIDVINIWNRTDAGQGRLDDFYVFVSDVPFTSTDLTTTMNQDGIWSRHVVVSGGPCPNVSLATDTVGRYVRIQLADTDYLSLAEVRVFGEAVMLGTSVAQGQTATQSSTGWGGTADKAVDGNTYGVYASGCVSHTLYNTNAWWQVDLGSLYAIDAIAIWNRTGAALDRLDDLYVFVSDEPFASTDPAATANQVGVWSRHVVVPGGPQPSVSLAVDAVGRYVRIQLTDTNYLSLAEVRVFGEGVTSGANIAQGKTTTQSSTGWGGSADKAVDGNTDGIYANGSVTHTQYNAYAWWQVDLGELCQVDAIWIWNRTDAAQDRLDDFHVFVSDTPFTSTDPVVTASQMGVWSRHVTAIPSPDVQIAVDAVGRYVRIQLADTNYLNLAEVKVFGQAAVSGANVAQGKPATQSSTGWGGSADKAVDGNTDGVYANGSVTHTQYNAFAWWQVDLGALYRIDAIAIWNRTDAGQDRLDDFYVFVSDTPFTSTDPMVTASQIDVWSRHIVGVPSPDVQIGADTTGRYVRIQLADTNYLNLAEVKIFGQVASLGSNVAQGKTAAQSSTGWGGSADKAVDGDTDGIYADGSVTHTQYDANASWEVDLGGLYQIDMIEIWNRTDAGQDRLDDFYVFVSDTPLTSTDLTSTMNQEGVWSWHVAGIPSPDLRIGAGAVGRYVRIQLADTNYLNLAEVRVFGTSLY